MKNLLSICGAALLAAAIATPATAQVPGTYSGTSADGQGMSFVVGTDPDTGALAVTSASIFFSAPCKNSTYILNTGWGFGTNDDIANGKVTISQVDNYFHFNIKLKFSSDGQSATGTILSSSPTLYPVSTRPTHSLFCTSPTQALNLTLEVGAVPAKAKVNQQSVRKNAGTQSVAADEASE